MLLLLRKDDPKRPCPYCGVVQLRLTRHLTARHRGEDAVQQALRLPKCQRDAAFTALRRHGILNANKELLSTERPDDELLRERTTKSGTTAKVAMCSRCHGFFSVRQIWAHKRKCGEERHTNAPASTVPVNTLRISTDDQFREKVLSCLRNDEVGRLCVSDKTILLCGERLYKKLKKKPDKATEVKRTVLRDMRKIAHMYIEFLKSSPVFVGFPPSAADMLCRDNFNSLETAIDVYTSTEDDLKAGLKSSLYYLLKFMASTVRGACLIERQDDRAAEIDRFLTVLEINFTTIFGDATYKLNQARQTMLRRPEALPKEADLSSIRNYSLSTIVTLISNISFTPRSFALLRDISVSRLTLFNFRRGGEPARLLLSQWDEAKRGVWVDTSRVQKMTETERAIFAELLVMYQTGKGNAHLVPVLVPKDMHAALDRLSDSRTRETMGINADNPYLFPGMQHRDSHCSGWHAVHRVCQLAGLPASASVTATKMRHYSSTVYAGFDVPDVERQFFYKHMGHSAHINATIYQTPLAEAEITVVGNVLRQIDAGTVACYLIVACYLLVCYCLQQAMSCLLQVLYYMSNGPKNAKSKIKYVLVPNVHPILYTISTFHNQMHLCI